MLTLYLGDTAENREKLVGLLCQRLTREDRKIKYIVKEPLLRTRVQEMLADRGLAALAPNPILTRDVVLRSREKPIHPALKYLYLLKLLEEGKERLELLGELPGRDLVSSIHGLFQELRSARVTPELFGKAVTEKMSTPKNRDLAYLYRAYTELLREKGLKEQEDLLWEALDDLRFSSSETIILDGFYNLDSFDRVLIQKLRTSGAEVHISYPYLLDSPAFLALEEGWRFLQELADKVEEAAPRKVGPIRVVKTQTPKQEAEFVLKTIKKLHWAGEIVHTDDVVVFTNKLKDYGPLFARACAREELAFREGPVRLDQTTVVKELKSLVALVSRPLEKEELRAILLSRYFNFEEYLSGAPQGEMAALLDRVRLTGTMERWSQRLAALGRSFPEVEKLRTALSGLAELQKFGKKLHTAPEIARFFLELLEKLKVHENLFVTSGFDPHQVLELRAFVEAKEHLISLAQQTGEELFKVGEFLTSWIYSLRSVRLNIAQDGISIHSITEAPLAAGKLAFVVGLSEGDFPQDLVESWTLSDGERAIINEFSPHRLGFTEEKEGLQDYLYWESLRCCSQVYLLRPQEVNGAVKESSRYIDEIEDFGVKEPCETVSIEPIITTSNEHLEYLVQQPDSLDMLPMDLQEKIKSYGQSALEKHTFPELGYQRELYERTVSVTAFDEYLDCPYRFFVHNMLELREEEPITDEVSSLEGGSLWHRVLELYYKDLLDRSPPFEFDEARFDAIVAEQFAAAKASEFYKKVEMEKYYETVKNYIAEDLARENFIVKSLEMSFGSGRVKGLQVGPYTLRGKIDRLDLLRGDVSKTGWVEGYFVTDYKRSGTSIDTAKATNRFQIKAYMLAIKNLGFSPVLGGKFHALTGETDYRCSLWADEILGRRSRLKLSIEEFEKELEGELQRAKNAAERLYGGVYTPNYESKSCRYCSFMALCQKPSRAEDAGDDNGD